MGAASGAEAKISEKVEETASGSVTSNLVYVNVRFLDLANSRAEDQAGSTGSGRISTARTCAPDSSSDSASVKPRPRAPPVTMMVRDPREKRSGVEIFARGAECQCGARVLA